MLIMSSKDDTYYAVENLKKIGFNGDCISHITFIIQEYYPTDMDNITFSGKLTLIEC